MPSLFSYVYVARPETNLLAVYFIKANKTMRQEKHLLSQSGENNRTEFQPELMNGKR
jgi:hypothetical protein